MNIWIQELQTGTPITWLGVGIIASEHDFKFQRTSKNVMQVRLGSEEFLSNEAVQAIQDPLVSRHKIQNLSLVVQGEGEQVESLLQLADMAKSLKQLVSFTLQVREGSILTPKESQRLAAALQAYLLLQQLFITFDQSPIGKDQAIEIGQGIRNCQKLTLLCLTISSSKIESSEIDGLLGGIHNINTLQSLTLRINQNTELGPFGGIAIGAAVKECKQLKYLILSLKGKNKCNAEGAQQIGQGVGELQNLTQLVLECGDDNNIQSAGAQGLGEALNNKESLNILQLEIGSGNMVRPQGAAGIGESLRKCPNIKTLFLCFNQNNSIGHEGAQALADGITACKELTSAVIIVNTGNRILNQGAVAIGRSLSFCPKLLQVFLDFKKNEINQNGAIQLRNELKKSRKLVDLKITIDILFKPIFLKLTRVVKLIIK